MHILHQNKIQLLLENNIFVTSYKKNDRFHFQDNRSLQLLEKNGIKADNISFKTHLFDVKSIRPLAKKSLRLNQYVLEYKIISDECFSNEQSISRTRCDNINMHN
jgi:hypothetical protein